MLLNNFGGFFCYFFLVCFEKEIMRKRIKKHFKSFFLTDSCPDTAAAVKGKEPFVVLSIEEDVREILSVIE